MGALTADELANIANTTLDEIKRGPAKNQYIEQRPLLNDLIKKQKTYNATAGNLKCNVKFTNGANFQGFEGDDTVSYTNLNNVKQASYGTSMIHSGIKVTFEELQKQGITVLDGGNGTKINTRMNKSDYEVITNLLEDKYSEMYEGWAINFDEMLHEDGTQDSKEVPGIKSLITDNSATGTVGGIDRSVSANALWRNRNSGYSASLDTITASESSQTITKFFRTEIRQLKRYGGTPTNIYCGSTALEALEKEYQAKGSYTESGFAKGTNDIGMATISINGIGTFVYDPTLDNKSEADRVYVLDLNAIRLRPLKGEDRRHHAPARPHDSYVMYKAMTWSGGLVADQLNSSGVYKLATA